MFVAALIGAAVDQRSISWKGIKERLRLSTPSATAWLWAAALSGFMYGGNGADLLAVTASWLALWKEKTGQKWMFGAILTAMLVKRYASLKTVSDTLPPQAIIRDKDTWISHEKGLFAAVKSGKQED